MDESPLTKLTERATAAHNAVNAQREAARQIALQATAMPPVSHHDTQAGYGQQQAPQQGT